MHQPDFGRLVAARHSAARLRDRVAARTDQRIIDGEVRATRRAMLRRLRWHGGRDAVAFLDEDFLRVADEPAIHQAILVAAILTSRADFVDLQLHDASAGLLHIVAQYGFPAAFVTAFAVVDTDGPTACAAAVRARRPVLVDDVAGDAIFAGQPSRDTVLQAGSRAVYSFPLLVPGTDDVAGVLSFHHRRTPPRLDMAELVAAGAARALVAHAVPPHPTPRGAD